MVLSLRCSVRESRKEPATNSTHLASAIMDAPRSRIEFRPIPPTALRGVAIVASRMQLPTLHSNIGRDLLCLCLNAVCPTKLFARWKIWSLPNGFDSIPLSDYEDLEQS